MKAGDLPNDPFNLQPIGTGPFAFQSLDTTKVEVALKRFDGYFGAKPHLEGLRFRSYASTAAAIQAVAQQDADGIGYIPPQNLGDTGAIANLVNIYGPRCRATPPSSST